MRKEVKLHVSNSNEKKADSWVKNNLLDDSKKTKRLTIDISEETHFELKILASKNRVSLSDLMRIKINEMLVSENL